MDLFEQAGTKDSQSRSPLAERMRPQSLQEFVGQEHLTGPGRFLRRAIEADQVPSLILWGPPGTGKTTLAKIIANATGAHFTSVSAVMVGVKDIREIIAAAQERWNLHRQRSILFIDEIHRFNKAQQDALLPHVERGTVTLIGATTENPSFEVNSALLSRTRVLTLRALEEDELVKVLERALADSRGLGGAVQADPDALEFLAHSAGRDARKALTALEVATQQGGRVTKSAAEEAVQQRTLLYDKSGEEHYNVISAFIKSMRGSDPDAALYWMVRMLEAGEDPLFILRRMVIFASEDIGNADPRALGVAVTEHGPLPVPLHLRNAPTPLMKSLGYGAGYQYPHNFEGSYVPEDYLPDALRGSRFYDPSQTGFERELSERVMKLRQQVQSASSKDSEAHPSTPSVGRRKPT